MPPLVSVPNATMVASLSVYHMVDVNSYPSIKQRPLFVPPPACGFHSSSCASSRSGRTKFGYALRVTGTCRLKMGTSWKPQELYVTSNLETSLGGNRLCQRATLGGTLTSLDLSMHTRVVRTHPGTSPLTIVRHLATDISGLHSISPLLSFYFDVMYHFLVRDVPFMIPHIDINM